MTAVKGAAPTSCATPTCRMAFHGFVEGDDIAEGTVDVVVTDGFTGNIALKTAEGTAKLVGQFLRRSLNAFAAGPDRRLHRRRARSTTLRRKLDPRAANGGIFLGLNGVVVKSHGGTDAMGFASALDMAIDHGQGRHQCPHHRRPRRASALQAPAPRPPHRDPHSPRHRLRRVSCRTTSSPMTIWPRRVDTSRRMDPRAHRHPPAPYRQRTGEKTSDLALARGARGADAMPASMPANST